MTIVEYIIDLYIYKKIDCFAKMKYEQKAYATSLIIGEAEANDVFDYLVNNHSSAPFLKHYLMRLLASYEDHLPKADDEILHRGFVDGIKMAAIELSKNRIESLFERLSESHPSREPEQDDEKSSSQLSYHRAI